MLLIFTRVNISGLFFQYFNDLALNLLLYFVDVKSCILKKKLIYKKKIPKWQKPLMGRKKQALFLTSVIKPDRK